MDPTLARILALVEEGGSILRASRSVGIPYSKAWNAIARAERELGVRLVRVRRGGTGGGGASLTEEGRRLLEVYERFSEEMGLTPGSGTGGGGEPDLALAHSHDAILEVVLRRLGDGGLDVEAACLGSGLALAALSLGEVDAAACHLLDPATGRYNGPYLERMWLGGRVDMLGWYWRQVVLAARPGLELRDLGWVLDAAARGEVEVVLRNRGSGTRILFDHLMGGREPARWREASTHDEVARMLAAGQGDVGLVLRHYADARGLAWIHAAWERFEYYALSARSGKRGVAALRETLGSEWLRSLLERTPGYSPPGPAPE